MNAAVENHIIASSLREISDTWEISEITPWERRFFAIKLNFKLEDTKSRCLHRL